MTDPTDNFTDGLSSVLPLSDKDGKLKYALVFDLSTPVELAGGHILIPFTWEVAPADLPKHSKLRITFNAAARLGEMAGHTRWNEIHGILQYKYVRAPTVFLPMDGQLNIESSDLDNPLRG